MVSIRTDKEPLSVDRDLDLAVTEFAPGSQKTKDKRILYSHRIHRSDSKDAAPTDSLQLLPTTRCHGAVGWRGAKIATIRRPIVISRTTKPVQTADEA